MPSGTSLNRMSKSIVSMAEPSGLQGCVLCSHWVSQGSNNSNRCQQNDEILASAKLNVNNDEGPRNGLYCLPLTARQGRRRRSRTSPRMSSHTVLRMFTRVSGSSSQRTGISLTG
jgi:hypothetical protein